MKYRLIAVCSLFLYDSLFSYNEYHITLAANAGSNINVSRCDFRAAGELLQQKKINFVRAQAGGVSFAPCSKSSKVAGVTCVAHQVTDLSEYDFSGAELVSADFSDAILKGANFTGANIEYANFTGADLTGAKIDNAINSSGAIFCNATMPDGKKCVGKSWTSKSGKVFLCHCSKQ